MDWTPIVTLVLGGIIGLGSSVFQGRRQDKSETTKWMRDRRSQVYSDFIRSFDEYTDALHFTLSQFPEWEIAPDPLPSIGSANRAFRNALSELSLLGPPTVTALAERMRYVTWHITGTVGEPGGDPYYSHWGSVRHLSDEFVATCRDVLRDGDPKGQSSEAALVEYQDWKAEWVKRPQK